MTEIWKPVQNYEGLYEVSSLGGLRSLDHETLRVRKYEHKPGRILLPHLNPNGYLQVSLCNKGKKVMKYIHRLVAQAFLPNPSHLPQINHKDENKTNNAVENLEWCDCRYNVNYGSAKARISQSHKELKKNSRPVVQIKDGETIATFGNCAIAGRETGIDASAITKVCLGRKRFKTAGGYVWRFLYPRPKAEGDWITLDDLLAQS